MSKTVILLNPYGTDVTPYLNGTNTYQLMSGTIVDGGDTLYTLPYSWDTSSGANIVTGAGLLDTKLNDTSGEILVFGYSEGCQIADYWLSNQALTTSVSPSNVTFLLIGNADRLYGGFAYARSVFNGVGYTGGKPADTPFTVTDFVRQYDPIGDFPTAAPIVDALTGLSYIGSDINAYAGAIQAVAAVMASTAYSNACLNAAAGLALIHTGLGLPDTGYMSVTVADEDNVALQQGNILWLWSPTYPVPMLGTGATFPQSDEQLRTQIEQAYSRPVDIPMPDYAANSGWSVEPFPNTAPITGWWAELYGTAAATITPVAAAAGQLLHGAAATITPTAAAAGFLTVFKGAAATVTPVAAAAGHLTLFGTAATTVTPVAAATGAPTPAYDDSAISAHQVTLASGTPFTWSSGGGTAGAYGIVFVGCYNTIMTLSATASVTWGGVTMTSLGGAYADDVATGGWGQVFVLNGIPAGAQTISVTLTQSGETFTGYAASCSYTNVSSVGTLQTAYGSSSTNPAVAVTAANPTDVVWGGIKVNNALTSVSFTTRQSANAFYCGDTKGSTTISGSTATSNWCAFGLDLQ